MDEERVNRRARLLFAGVIVAVFAAGGLWMLLSSTAYTTYRIETTDVVSGLIADAPVEFHGVEVGRVRSVELTAPRTVSILLDVKDGAPVSGATVATITARGLAMRGFTGYVYVALENTGAEGKPLAVLPGQRYPVIPATPSRIVNMDLAIAQVNENVQGLTRLAQGLLDPATVASLKDSVASIERVSRTLARDTARLERLLANADRASADAPAFMRASRETMARVDGLLDPATLESLHRLAGSLERVAGMLAQNNTKLDALIVRGEVASRELAPLMESTDATMTLLRTQVLPEAQRTLTQVQDISSAMTGVARKVERDPSVILRGARPPPPGPGEAK